MEFNWKHPFFISAVVLTGIICILFYNVIFQGNIFGSPDTLAPKSSGIILQKSYEESGEFPLWQPWIFSGMPTAEAFTFLSYLYFPGILLKLLFIKGLFAQLLHLLFAGIGGFILLRSLKLSSVASFLGSTAFMITPFMITMVVFGHGSQMMTAAYLPWIIWMTIKIMEKPSICNAGLLAILFGFQLQRAHAQIAYYTWMLAGAYVLYMLITNFKNQEKRKSTFIGFGSFTGAAILGIGIALLIYLPSIEYTPFSVRGGGTAGGADYNYATSWSFHPKEMLTFLLPSAFGFGGQTYWGFMPFTDYPNYMGIIVLLLAVYGFSTKRNNLTWFMLGTSILAIFISFGKHFSLIYDLFFNIFPYFNKFRVPTMILILLQFNIAVLAAIGLDALIGLKEKIIPRWFWIASGAIGLWLLILVMGSGMLESSLQNSFTQPRTRDPNAIRTINNLRLEIWNKDAWLLVLWVGFGLGAVWMWIHRKINKNTFLAAITVAAIIDIGLVDWRIIHPDRRSGRSASTMSLKTVDRYFDTDPVINFLQKQKGDFRIYPVGNLFGESRFRAFGLESVGGYHPAKLKITNDFIQKTKNISSFSLMKMLNVHYIISQQPIQFPGLVEVFKGKMRSGRGVISPTVYELKDKLPRAWFVENVEAKSNDQLWGMINEANFNPEDIAYIKSDDDRAGVYSKGTINNIEKSIHTLRLNVSCEEIGFLLVSEVHYPLRWKCTIDGQPAETIETNKLIRGIIIPKGEHTVKFIYDRSSFNKGKMISGLSFVIALGLLGVGIYNKRRRS
jgi:hypothetical protein